ncbi:MAG: uroporphyrinogen decarboxylase family protein [Nitrospirota bacterium]|jgi:uroporphyrinogen decarboxylase
MAVISEQMTSLERVGTALQFKEPDRVPAAPLVCGATHRVAGITYGEWSRGDNVEAMVRGHVDSLKMLGYDGVVALVDLSVEAHDFGCEVIFPEFDTAHPNYDDPFIKGPEDYKKIERINPRKTKRMKSVIDMIAGLSKEIGKTHAIVGFVYGSLGTLSMMRGPENFFMDLVEHPDVVLPALQLMDEVLEEYAVAQVEAGAHSVCYDNLYASQSILSKDLWEKVEGQGIKKVCDAIQNAGAIVSLHNCGNGIYFDMSQKWANPTAISHAYVADDVDSWEEHKAKWGDKIATIGWIPPGPVAMLGTEEEIEEECKAELEIFKKGGGYILATGCEFPPNSPLYNAKLIADAAKKYGVY